MALPCLSVLLLLLTSCATLQTSDLPDIRDSPFMSEATQKQVKQHCEQVFFQGHIQFVHSIVFELANGHSSTVIGVTVINGKTLKTALLGVEGFVFFEAELTDGQALQVNRALPPFDNPEFAAGLIGDVQILFQAPSYKELYVGHLTDGKAVCRYFQEEGQITDIVPADENMRINVYGTRHDTLRTIVTVPRITANGAMVPETIFLKAHGINGYTLNMTLISADVM